MCIRDSDDDDDDDDTNGQSNLAEGRIAPPQWSGAAQSHQCANGPAERRDITLKGPFPRGDLNPH